MAKPLFREARTISTTGIPTTLWPTCACPAVGSGAVETGRKGMGGALEADRDAGERRRRKATFALRCSTPSYAGRPALERSSP